MKFNPIFNAAVNDNYKKNPDYLRGISGNNTKKKKKKKKCQRKEKKKTQIQFCEAASRKQCVVLLFSSLPTKKPGAFCNYLTR